MVDTRVIGVDLGGTKILAGLIDADGTIREGVQRETPVRSQAALLDALDEAAIGRRTPEVAAVGFAIPARVDVETGLARWRDVVAAEKPKADEALRRAGLEPLGTQEK